MTDSELLDLVYDAVIVREPDGTIVKWNKAAADRFGYTEEEAVGRRVEELLKRSAVGCRDGEVWVSGRDGLMRVSSWRSSVTSSSHVVEVYGPVASRPNTDLRLVIDHLPGLVSYIDKNFRYRFANHTYQAWFGNPVEEIVGASVPDVLGAVAFERVRPEMERALSGELVRFDTLLQYARGGAKHVSVCYVPDRDEQTAEVRGFVVLVLDETARHQAEQLLRASEKQYRQIVETALEGIWAIGIDSRTIFANRRMAELLGTTVERLHGQDSFLYVFEEDVEEARRLFGNKMRGDRDPFEFRLRRANGTALWARVSGVPMTDEQGNVSGILGMFTDITARHLSEQALRLSEERFRTLLANLPDIVSRFDRNGRFIYVSPAVENATGRPTESFLGKNHHEAGIPDPPASYLSGKLAEIVRTGKPEQLEFEMTTADGVLRKYDGLGVPEFGEDGSVRTVLTIVHDVTSQRRSEEALRRSNADLEQFAYAAAHDLQEPLRVVGMYTELFLRRHVNDQDESALHAASFIRSGVRRMQSLVRDLLAYSRTVHEELQTPTATSLDAALDQALGTLDDVVTESAARIEREALPLVIGESGQLAQVFQNLLSNAIKYRRDGQAPIVKVWAERSNSDWVISVHDYGIGFDPQYAERIFGLFKRLHRDAYPGTGVGLGICRRIVERHGGKIWAESDGPDLGATFRFTVRAADSA